VWRWQALLAERAARLAAQVGNVAAAHPFGVYQCESQSQSRIAHWIAPAVESHTRN